MPKHEHGSMLLACLLLVTMLGLLATGALRSASTDSQLTLSLDTADQAGALADAALARGLNIARRQPDRLPSVADTELVLSDASDPATGLLQTRIRFVGQLEYCPGTGPMPATSLHFEIIGTGTAGNATARHLQGIALCRPNCAAGGCPGPEHPVQLTYATRMEP